MSLYIEFEKTGAIKLDTIANQISKGVAELKRHYVPPPFTVQLTRAQYELLKAETEDFLSYPADEGSVRMIHGCKIEVIE